ncbi:riboflavin biosynthesis pyrimidine reductase [Rhizobium sp. BK251]|nr:riboflavin biosynthesis pyrimidine reductase [Rhizobium sp. BK251]
MRGGPSRPFHCNLEYEVKPHVTMHMGSSIDGRIVPTHWPQDLTAQLTEVYEQIHQSLEADGWIVGRVTMADFADGEPRPAKATEVYPRTTWKAPSAERGPYAIAIDRHARLHMNTGSINGDPLVLILTEDVPDDHLAELRRDGISYIFAGRSEIDLAVALDLLASDFGVKRLLLEGGGGINGSFLAAGLIDEISLFIIPVADGTTGMPSTFDRDAAPSRRLSLKSVETLEHDVLHLRYQVA